MATAPISSQTIIFLFGLVLSATAYSKYGRTCQDIGCLPNEVCQIAQDSCSWSQREGKDCGSYPTCKKAGSGSTSSSPGASLNPAPDNTHVNHENSKPSYGGNYNPTYSGGHGIPPPVDPNQIFGNPNRQPQSNQPWSNLPIFPNPTSHASQPQQPLYPQIPQYNPTQNRGGSVGGGGIFGNLNPYQVPPQQPFAFGVPPPQGPIMYRPTTRQPSLLDQFLYNKQGGRRNSASMHDIMRPHVILIIGICNAVFGVILAIIRPNH